MVALKCSLYLSKDPTRRWDAQSLQAAASHITTESHTHGRDSCAIVPRKANHDVEFAALALFISSGANLIGDHDNVVF